jgi:hypothetical protein
MKKLTMFLAISLLKIDISHADNRKQKKQKP